MKNEPCKDPACNDFHYVFPKHLVDAANAQGLVIPWHFMVSRYLPNSMVVALQSTAPVAPPIRVGDTGVVHGERNGGQPTDGTK